MRTRPIRRELPAESGQNLVEFALTLPIFVGLLLGFFYAAVMLYSQVTLTNAARVGTNYLVRNPDASDAEVTAEMYRYLGGLNPTLMTVTISPPEGSRVPNVQVDVALSYRVPLPGLRVPNLGQSGSVHLGSMLLVADSTMNLE